MRFWTTYTGSIQWHTTHLPVGPAGAGPARRRLCQIYMTLHRGSNTHQLPQMQPPSPLPCGPRGEEPLLFTPGPLTTSRSVKEAMLVDLGSRDARFLSVVREIREELLAVAGVSSARGYECVIMQGSGTFGVEAVLSTALPRSGAKLLICENGAYGRRMAAMSARMGVPTTTLSCSERCAVEPVALASALAADPGITHVAVVHHETTAGVLNDVPALGAVVTAAARGIILIVDSMSGFGAYPLDVAEAGVDYLVSSSNKNFEGARALRGRSAWAAGSGGYAGFAGLAHSPLCSQQRVTRTAPPSLTPMQACPASPTPCAAARRCRPAAATRARFRWTCWSSGRG